MTEDTERRTEELSCVVNFTQFHFLYSFSRIVFLSLAMISMGHDLHSDLRRIAILILLIVIIVITGIITIVLYVQV